VKQNGGSSSRMGLAGNEISSSRRSKLFGNEISSLR